MTDCLAVGSGSNPLEAAKNLPEGDYNTGSGMTPDTQRKAFDPFFTTKFAGRGMGLATVQRIVRGLGGGIHVVSSPGTGARIQVLLPSVAETALTNKRRAAVRPRDRESRLLGGIRILIVEDEPALLLSVSKLLQHRGFRGLRIIQPRALRHRRSSSNARETEVSRRSCRRRRLRTIQP
jgi:hypothetical protein